MINSVLWLLLAWIWNLATPLLRLATLGLRNMATLCFKSKPSGAIKQNLPLVKNILPLSWGWRLTNDYLTRNSSTVNYCLLVWTDVRADDLLQAEIKNEELLCELFKVHESLKMQTKSGIHMKTAETKRIMLYTRGGFSKRSLPNAYGPSHFDVHYLEWYLFWKTKYRDLYLVLGFFHIRQRWYVDIFKTCIIFVFNFELDYKVRDKGKTAI